MATRRNRSFVLVCTALTTALLVVSAGMAGNAWQNQQNRQQLDNQSSEQQGSQSGDQMGWQDQQDQQQFGTQAPQQPDYQRGGQMDARGGMQANRNQPLERQVASQLRDQGLGQQGQLLVLAVGNRVILLGAVPDPDEKQQAEQISSQVSGVGQVDNRIVVLSRARRKSDTQLQRDIQQQLSQLPDGIGRNIQVQARNGRIILRGQVNDWIGMADAIHAAFNAGASYIVSQITTGQAGRTYGRMGTEQGRTQMDQDSDYGRGTTDQYGQYGYQAPGTYDQDQQYDRYDRSRSQWDTDRGRMDQYGRTTGRDRWRQTSEDHRQEQELTSKLRSDIQGLEDVTILVAGNKVFIFGRAQSQSAKDQATSLAKEISGIQRVQNNLIVSARAMPRQDDSTLRTNITEELQSSPFLDNADRIRVSVRNGTATLSGRVDSFGEMVAAIESAYQGGARSVQNRITVSGQTTPRRDTEGYYPSYGYEADQSTSGRSGAQSGITDQSTSSGYTTQNVAYRTGGGSSNRSVSGRYGDQDDQDDSYRPYDYTPGEERGRWQDTDATRRRPMGWQRTSTSDLVLAHRIALELQRRLPSVQNIHVLNPRAIYVVVNQNTVTLHGYVQDRTLKQQAEQIARSIRGVQNVQNQLIVAGEAGAFPPLGYTPGQQMTPSDRNLAQQIDQQIRQQLSGANITVTVIQGTATLQGTVRDQNQKQQAEQIAESVSGIENVQNNLTVSGRQSTYGQRYTTGQMGQSQTGFQQTSTSDKVLAHQVALELQQQLPSSEIVYVLDTQAINVMVSEGTVMLHGSAQDQNTKQQAEQIARSVSGARNVHNALIILGPPQQRQTMGQQQQMPMTSTDRRLAQQIQQQLQQQFPGSSIHVMISQGTATLHGTVQSQNQKQQAEQIARSISGVQSVENNLTVSAARGAFPPFGYTPGEDDTSQDTESSSGMGYSDQPQTY